jgi:hypothetical protein
VLISASYVHAFAGSAFDGVAARVVDFAMLSLFYRF